MHDSRTQTSRWKRLFAEWRPGLFGAAACGVLGAGILGLVQRYLYSSHVFEAIFAIAFLCYCAVVLGYAIARGHDDTQEGRAALARVVRKVIPYRGKRIAVLGLVVSLGVFLGIAAARTPASLSSLDDFVAKTALGISEDDTKAARLHYLSEGYKADPKAFWRKLILGIDSLQVVHGDRIVRYLVPEGQRADTERRMRDGFVLANAFSPNEYGSLELLEHLHELRANRVSYVVRTFAYTLMETFGWMATFMYLSGMLALVAHRRERALRQRLYAKLAAGIVPTGQAVRVDLGLWMGRPSAVLVADEDVRGISEDRRSAHRKVS